MKIETVKVILKLLERIQIQGSEVPAFNQVISELVQELQPTDEVKKEVKKAVENINKEENEKTDKK